MGKTYRTEPSSKSYTKRHSHVSSRKLKENTEDSLTEYPYHKHNRIISSHSQITNHWDDKIISEYHK